MFPKYLFILGPALIIISLLKRPNVLQLKKVIFYFTTLLIMGLAPNEESRLNENVAVFILLASFIVIEILSNVQKTIRNEKKNYCIDEVVEG